MMIRINHLADELGKVRACLIAKLHARAGYTLGHLYYCSPNII